jgi:hypothetical protein
MQHLAINAVITITVELADGRRVPADSLEYMRELAVIARHIRNLHGREVDRRTRYFESIEQTWGAEMRRRVALAFATDVEARKARNTSNTQLAQA